jgi:hypothetical protein
VKLKAVVTALTLTLCAVVSMAQDQTFRYVIGRDPNSTDFRAAIKAARRLNAPTSTVKSLTGDDWAFNVGQNGGMTQNMWPGAFNNFITPACTDWVAFPLAVAGSATQANFVVLTSLYRGTSGLCGTGQPQVKVAYNIGTTVLGASSAPDISYKGTSKGLKLAFIEGANAKLHIVTLGSGGTVAAPIQPDGVGTHGSEVVLDYTNTATAHCAAGTVHTANTTSGVYVDFSTDDGYVADDGGRVYHITGIFNGTPTMDFCGSFNGGAPIGTVFQVNVGGTDFVHFISNGRLLFRTAVNATRTGFTGTTNLALGTTANTQGDILYDSSVDVIYGWNNHGTTTNAQLKQVSAQTTPMAVIGSVNLGPASALQLNNGEFDNTFWTLGAGASGATGYTCIYPNGAGNVPGLASYQFNASGIITGLTAMNDNVNIDNGTSNGNGNGCQISFESFDNTTGVDQLFVSTGDGVGTLNNKMTRWDISSPLILNSATPTNSVTNNTGGTSNSVLDFTDSASNQTNNIYFGIAARPSTARCGGTPPLANYCVVKLTQGALN